MAEAHQRDLRDDQDRQQGQQASMVLPNVTVLILGKRGGSLYKEIFLRKIFIS